MDYARKIGKTQVPERWRKTSLEFKATRDGFMTVPKNPSEDQRLINWEKWLANRRAQHKRVRSATGRHQIDQVINTCETVRPLVEMRTLMDYATVPVPVIPDKYRGGPEFWRTPQELHAQGDACLPKVTIVPGKKELNVAPELTYVDLPELIEKEKDLVGIKSKEPLWMRSKYLKKRRRELSKEIELLIPKEPETRHLVIEGHAARQKKKLERYPPITISDTEEENEDKPQVYPDQAAVLKIQERVIVWQRAAFEEADADPIEWRFVFSSQINRTAEKEVTFENKGNRVIVYQWRTANFESEMIPVKTQASPFYFNKTKGVIPPGQFVKLKVWYRPQASGVSKEVWRLLTEPELCPSLLTFQFWGCAETVDTRTRDSDAAMVDKYLDRCIRDVIIKDIVSEIVEDIDTIKMVEPFYGNLFLESEIFTAKNPLCYYHPSTLIQLHNLYYTATNQRKQRWNLSLNEFRELLLTLGEPENRHNMMSQLNKLYKECLKPSFPTPIRYAKYQLVYNLLCSFLNQFEAESAYAKKACYKSDHSIPVATVSSMETIKSIQMFHVSAKSSYSRGKRGRKSSTRMQSAQVQETVRNFGFDDRPYREIFFIRIYELLEKMVERAFASIDSFNNLNERDK